MNPDTKSSRSLSILFPIGFETEEECSVFTLVTSQGRELKVHIRRLVKETYQHPDGNYRVIRKHSLIDICDKTLTSRASPPFTRSSKTATILWKYSEGKSPGLILRWSFENTLLEIYQMLKQTRDVHVVVPGPEWELRSQHNQITIIEHRHILWAFWNWIRDQYRHHTETGAVYQSNIQRVIFPIFRVLEWYPDNPEGNWRLWDVVKFLYDT